MSRIVVRQRTICSARLRRADKAKVWRPLAAGGSPQSCPPSTSAHSIIILFPPPPSHSAVSPRSETLLPIFVRSLSLLRLEAVSPRPLRKARSELCQARTPRPLAITCQSSIITSISTRPTTTTTTNTPIEAYLAQTKHTLVRQKTWLHFTLQRHLKSHSRKKAYVTRAAQSISLTRRSQPSPTSRQHCTRSASRPSSTNSSLYNSQILPQQKAWTSKVRRAHRGQLDAACTLPTGAVHRR